MTSYSKIFLDLSYKNESAKAAPSKDIAVDLARRIQRYIQIDIKYTILHVEENERYAHKLSRCTRAI